MNGWGTLSYWKGLSNPTFLYPSFTIRKKEQCRKAVTGQSPSCWRLLTPAHAFSFCHENFTTHSGLFGTHIPAAPPGVTKSLMEHSLIESWRQKAIAATTRWCWCFLSHLAATVCDVLCPSLSLNWSQVFPDLAFQLSRRVHVHVLPH